jgi:hypothetical protein
MRSSAAMTSCFAHLNVLPRESLQVVTPTAGRSGTAGRLAYAALRLLILRV